MYNLYEEFDKCEQNLKAHNIPICDNISVRPNTRAKARWGQCKWTRRNGHIIKCDININADLLDERNPLDTLHQTIYHELLHTIDDCQGHKGLWKEYAEKVNRITGLNIQRCNSAQELGVVAHNTNSTQPKYMVWCPCCNRRNYYKRATKLVKHPDWFQCGICKETLQSKEI